MVQNLWDSSKAAALTPGLDELVYRSNLLGVDRRVCNWGGGNTSSKTIEKRFSRARRRGDVGKRQRIGPGDDEGGKFHRLAYGRYPAAVRAGGDVR